MKNGKIFLGALCSVVFMISCNDKERVAPQAEKNIDVVEETKPEPILMEMKNFTEFPPEIHGCSCYYSLNNEDFKSNQYIMAANFGKDCFIKIKGAMIKLELEKEGESTDSHSQKTYAGDGFTLQIDTEKISELDETWQQKGTILLEHNGLKVFESNIVGECGC